MEAQMMRRQFRANDLAKMADAGNFQHQSEVPLRIGDIIALNSGGPRMMVVDHDNSQVVAAWVGDDGSALEGTFQRVTVHRVTPL
jgi:uncharacterized protein YodC (DUF2158 family)